MHSTRCGPAVSLRDAPPSPRRPTPLVLFSSMDHDPLRRGFAEFVGTFTLVFIGAGSTLTLAKTLAPLIGNPPVFDVYSGVALVGVALANGLAIGVMVSAVGHISGGHFNPAVTFGFLITRRIVPSLAIVYWSMQFAAAAAAAALLRWFYPAERARSHEPRRTRAR